MAEEAAEPVSGGDSPEAPPVKCPECPAGLPAWMATFSDLVTLLLTFFVLLLSFAKTETAKYEAALGSVRNAFGGNVLQKGEVLQLGKSPDNQPTMLEATNPIRPFPIDFLTMEGLLDKHEINRESTETLDDMKNVLAQNDLSDNVNIYEMPEGVKVVVRDKILFKKGTSEAVEVNVKVFQKVTELMSKENWSLFVLGHASKGETSLDGKLDALSLSAIRAQDVARSLIERGVRANRISIVAHGDTKPDSSFQSGQDSKPELNRRVEFILRKVDLQSRGHKVDAR